MTHLSATAAPAAAQAVFEVALVDRHHIPVDGPLRRDRHVGHEIDGPLVEARPHLRNDFDGGAFELAAHARQLDEKAVLGREEAVGETIVGDPLGRPVTRIQRP